MYKFGQIVLYDYLQNIKMEGNENFELFTFDDIDKAFNSIQTVKYNQMITIPDANRSMKSNNLAVNLTKNKHCFDFS